MTEEEFKQSNREFRRKLDDKSRQEECLMCFEIAMAMEIPYRIVRTEIRASFEQLIELYPEDEYCYIFEDGARTDGYTYDHVYYIPEDMALDIFSGFRKEHLDKLKEAYKDLYYPNPKQKNKGGGRCVKHLPLHLFFKKTSSNMFYGIVFIASNVQVKIINKKFYI